MHKTAELCLKSCQVQLTLHGLHVVLIFLTNKCIPEDDDRVVEKLHIEARSSSVNTRLLCSDFYLYKNVRF